MAQLEAQFSKIVQYTNLWNENKTQSKRSTEDGKERGQGKVDSRLVSNNTKNRNYEDTRNDDVIQGQANQLAVI